MLRLREVAPAVLQHLDGYCDLAKAAAQEFRQDLARRVAFALAGVISAVVALLYASVWALLAAWESPARHWVGAGIFALLALIAIICFQLSRRRAEKLPHAALLGLELNRDRQLLAELHQGARP